MKRATQAVSAGVDNMEISIHALVKRATPYQLRYDNVLYISIHALVKRATSSAEVRVPILPISIHALVKRATVTYCSNQVYGKNFNPRPREEGDTEVF